MSKQQVVQIIEIDMYQHLGKDKVLKGVLIE